MRILEASRDRVHARIQKLLSRGSNFNGFLCAFSVGEGEGRIQIPLLAGHHRLSLVLRLCFCMANSHAIGTGNLQNTRQMRIFLAAYCGQCHFF